MSSELQAQEPRAVAHPAGTAVTPAQMLQIAVERGADIEQLTRLMDLQERYEANQARQAYMEAVAAFKQNPPHVVKDRVNDQYGSRYVSLSNLVATVTKHLAMHGLNTRWEFVQTDTAVTVTCVLSHVMGHRESVSLSAPPDISGKKNPIQQLKSTITYLEAATLQAVTGVACVDPGEDDDGNGAVPGLSLEQIATVRTALEAAGITETDVLEKARTDSLAQIDGRRYQAMLNWIKGQKGNQRKAQAPPKHSAAS